MMDELPNVRLRRLRTSAGLTLQDVAKKAGLTKGHISKMETNYESMMRASYLNLSKLAQVFNTTVSEMMEH